MLVDLTVKEFLNKVAGSDPVPGVDNGKLLSVPLALAVLTVTCGAGGVADDSTTRLCESVKKRRLTYIRASYYCY